MKKIFHIFIGLILLVFVIINGIFYDGYDHILNALINNQLTPEFDYSLNNLYKHHVFITNLNGLLLKINSNFNYLSIIYYSCLLICYLLLIKIFINKIKKRDFYFIYILFISLFFIQNIIFISYTRLAFLLCFVGLFGLSDSKSYLEKILFYILFIVGLLHRGESAFAVLLIFMIYDIIYLKSYKLSNGFSLIKKYFIPICSIIFFALWIKVEFSPNNSIMELDYILEFEIQFNKNFIINNDINDKDSLRVIAIKDYYGDLDTNNSSFITSIFKQKNSSLITFWSNFKNKIEKLNRLAYEFIIDYKYYYLFVINIILILLTLYNTTNKIKILIFNILIYLILISTAFQFKMTERILSSFLFIGNILLLFQFSKNSSNNKILYIFMTPIVVLELLFISNLSIENKTNINFYEKKQDDLKQIAGNYEVYAMTGQSVNYLLIDLQSEIQKNPFKKNSLNKFKRVDLSFIKSLIFSDHYRAYISNKCSCNPLNWKEYFTFLKVYNQGKLFIMNERDEHFYETYLLTVHDLKIDFIKFTSQINFENNSEKQNELYLYEIK